MNRKFPRAHSVSSLLNIRGIEPELFVAGVLAILLVLACLRSFLPTYALAAVGVAAFSAMLATGLFLQSVRKSAPSRDAMLGLIALFAIVWIAAGRLHIASF